MCEPFNGLFATNAGVDADAPNRFGEGGGRLLTVTQRADRVKQREAEKIRIRKVLALVDARLNPFPREGPLQHFAGGYLAHS